MAFHPITLVALAPEAQRSVAWVSVGDTGDVSAGLTDRSIVIADPGGERDGSRNPHFTFHPPIYHHLRSNGEPEVLAALMEIGAMLKQTAVVPWVRLVSRPYQHLATFQRTRGAAGVLGFSIADPGLSAQIELDFIRPSEIRAGDSQFKYARVSSDLGLRLAVQSCPPSRASLTLLWQG